MLKEIFAIVLAVLAFEIIQAQSRPSVLGNTDPEKDRVLLQHGVHRKSRANTRFLVRNFNFVPNYPNLPNY